MAIKHFVPCLISLWVMTNDLMENWKYIHKILYSMHGELMMDAKSIPLFLKGRLLIQGVIFSFSLLL